MSSTINLGSIVSQNGRNTANGIASGLDSSSLIEGILESKQVQITNLEDDIVANDAKVAALGELSLLLEQFRTASDFLRNPPGVNNESNDLFKYTNVTSTSNTSTPASTYVNVISEAGATTNSYLIENVVLAEEHVIRKDNFTSQTSSVVGNLSVTDDYTASMTYVSGTALNTTTPVTFSNDVRATSGEAATIDVVFGSQNNFDALDEFVVGGTTITFGGTGGSDLTDAGSVSANVSAIAAHLNGLSSGDEAGYTYTANGNTLTITRDVVGDNATVTTDLAITADFSKGENTTQTVAIGSLFKSNAAVTGTVSANGLDGSNAATKSSIELLFSGNVSAGDTITIGSSNLTFDTDVTVGGSLDATLKNLANVLNNTTSGTEAGYSFSVSGSSLVATRDSIGAIATVGGDIDISANFGVSAATLKVGSAVAATTPNVTNAIANNGTNGVDFTPVTDANTTKISGLNGAITIGATPTFNVGSAIGTTDFNANNIQLTATVNGVTYTSKAIELAGGSIDSDTSGSGDNNTGTNGFGNRIASGTIITFVADDETDDSSGKSDITFQLVVGDAVTIDDQTDANTFATDINSFLTTNTVAIEEDTTVPEFRAGTFSLQGVDITLAAGDNLSVIKSKINAVSGTTGVTADIVKVSDDNFSLVIKSKETGLENAISSFDLDALDGASAGMFSIGGGNVEFTQIQAAADSSIDLDGQTITRSSNSMNDIVDKITFNLLSESAVSAPDTDISVSVSPDTDVAKNGIADFLSAYNELKLFISAQKERDSNNQLVETAVLGNEAVLDRVFQPIQAQVSSIVSGLSSSSFQSLFEIGIDFTDFAGDGEIPETNDIFTLDEERLDAALSSDFEAVRDLFTYTFTSSSPDLAIFSRTNSSSLINYTLDIDTSRDSGEEVQVKDSNGTFLFFADFNESDQTITGRAGTDLQGTKFIYTGSGVETIDVTATQGISDNIFNFLDNFLDEEDGNLKLTIDEFTGNNSRIQDNIDRENERLEAEREILILRFSQLESFISEINNTLDFIASQFDAFNNN